MNSRDLEKMCRGFLLVLALIVAVVGGGFVYLYTSSASASADVPCVPLYPGMCRKPVYSKPTR